MIDRDLLQDAPNTPDTLSFSSTAARRTCSSLSICSFSRSSSSCIIIRPSSGLMPPLVAMLWVTETHLLFWDAPHWLRMYVSIAIYEQWPGRFQYYHALLRGNTFEITAYFCKWTWGLSFFVHVQPHGGDKALTRPIVHLILSNLRKKTAATVCKLPHKRWIQVNHGRNHLNPHECQDPVFSYRILHCTWSMSLILKSWLTFSNLDQHGLYFNHSLSGPPLSKWTRIIENELALTMTEG